MYTSKADLNDPEVLYSITSGMAASLSLISQVYAEDDNSIPNPHMTADALYGISIILGIVGECIEGLQPKEKKAGREHSVAVE